MPFPNPTPCKDIFFVITGYLCHFEIPLEDMHVINNAFSWPGEGLRESLLAIDGMTEEHAMRIIGYEYLFLSDATPA